MHSTRDILESVLDHSDGRPNTLCSPALTCGHLCHPSHLAMFGRRVQLKSYDCVMAFMAFVQANPELKPFVRTIAATPAAFEPSPLYILPNLSSIECVDESQLGEPEDDSEDRDDKAMGDKAADDDMPPISDYMWRRPQTGVRVGAQRSLILSQASLICFTQLGARIRTLRLSSISFPTLLSFARVLGTFASVKRLVCEGIEIEAAGAERPLEVATRWLSKQIQLKELVIDSYSLARGDDAPCPGTLLFDTHLAPSIVESLVVEVSRLDLFPYQSDLRQLQRLELRFSGEASIAGVTEFLERFPGTPKLKHLLIKWRGWSPKLIVEALSCKMDESNPRYQELRKLDHTLLRFPHSRVSFVVAGSVDTKTLSFWACELGNHLPMVLDHGGAVTAECSEALDSSAAPHHDSVQASDSGK